MTKKNIVLILILLAGALSLCAQETNSPSTLELKKENRSVLFSAVGTFRSRTTSIISAQVSARVEKIMVQPGMIVEKGQVLAKLDRRQYESKLAQAQGQLSAVEAGLKLATSNHERAQELFNNGTLTREAMDTAQGQLDEARGRLLASTEALKEAELVLNYTTINAPLKGMLVQKFMEEGDLANAGNPLFEIHDPNRLRLEASVPESILPHLELGKSFKLKASALDLELDGVLEEIIPSADPTSRSFLVKLVVPTEARLYPGMYGQLQVPTGTRQVLCVPKSAITSTGQLDRVRIKEQGQWLSSFVRLGEVFSDARVEILSGLKEGDVIALNEIAR